jgi:hypothetical protein
MVTDRFGSLMEDLGKLIRIRLIPDSHNACLIKYPGGLFLQIELDQSQERINMGAEIGSLAPGRYRENVMREALKANGLPPPKVGIFAFSAKKEVLILFDYMELNDLTAPKIADFLEQFLQKANFWKDAIKRGDVPSFMGNEMSFGKKTGGAGMFGL